MLRPIEYFLSKIVKKLHLRSIKGCTLHRTAKVCAGSQLVNSEMGKYSDIGYDCSIAYTKIGSFVSMGSNCTIGGARHMMTWVSTSPVFCANKDHLQKKFSRHPFNAFAETTIGSDVWISDCVMIKGGVTVGHGAVIGMGSIVTRNVPPYEIWAGNPAKMIRKRFDDETIAALLRIKWWDLEDDILAIKAKHFDDVHAFIRSAGK